MKGLLFTFEVRGNEVFFDRKAKSGTRSTIIQAYRKEEELHESGILVDGLKNCVFSE